MEMFPCDITCDTSKMEEPSGIPAHPLWLFLGKGNPIERMSMGFVMALEKVGLTVGHIFYCNTIMNRNTCISGDIVKKTFIR